MENLGQKKEELIKGFKASSTTLDDFKKYALLRCQGGIQFFANSDLIMVCDKESEIIDYLEQLKKFGEKIVSDEMREDLMKVLFKLEEGKEISTRKNAQIEVMQSMISKEIGALGNNMWGLFNGVTMFTTHKLEAREEVFGNFTGRKAEIYEAAYQFCLEKVNA